MLVLARPKHIRIRAFPEQMKSVAQFATFEEMEVVQRVRDPTIHTLVSLIPKHLRLPRYPGLPARRRM